MFLLSFGSHSALYALVTSQAWALPDDLSARQSRRAGPDTPIHRARTDRSWAFIWIWLLMEGSGTRAAVNP